MPKAEKDFKKKKKISFKTKELLKNTQYTEPAHCRKTPGGGGLTQAKIKTKQNKKKSEKGKKVEKDVKIEKELKTEKERNGEGRNQGTHQDREKKLKKKR